MNFQFSDEHNLMRQMVREFAESELGPSAASRDEEERFDRSLMFGRLAELGLTGMVFPEELGGAGADYISYAIVIEELARVCASTAVVLSVHLSLTSRTIHRFGSKAQIERFLRPLIAGEKLGAFALTESNAGSDAAALETKARQVADGYLLNGRKIFVTNGGSADIYIVFCRTDQDAKKHRGISAFIVEKGRPGFTFGKKERKLGIRSSLTCDLIFDDCLIPKENLLGAPGEGFEIAMACLDNGRIGIAAQALGIAQGAYEAALEYSRQRHQFGRAIVDFQAVAFKIADMATRIEAARLLIYQASHRASLGLSFAKESAMAKLFASETAVMVTDAAVQIHGGYGYIRDFPVERMLRDARITEIYEGTSEIQRLVISKAVI